MRFVARRLARDRSALLGLILVLLVVLAAILAPLISTHPEAVWDMSPANRLKPPSRDWLLGTDRMGADIYSRVIFGARITLLIALVAVGAALLIGVPIGLWAGWHELWIGELLMRVSDVFLALPQIVLAIALGVPNRRIVLQHVLPNVISPIIVRTSIGMGFTILTAAALGFLGLGAPPPAPEWGRMISEAREFLPEAWWYPLAPGLAIFLVVMGFNLLGDGLRDVLDPRIRRASTGR